MPPPRPAPSSSRTDEPALLAKVNETLKTMDDAGDIDRLWKKWLGPDTEYKMTRDEKVVPLSQLKFDPIP